MSSYGYAAVLKHLFPSHPWQLMHDALQHVRSIVEVEEKAQLQTADTTADEELRMLLYLLVFDAWHDLLTSEQMNVLQSRLSAGTSSEEEQTLASQVAGCIASLPEDTDGWMRLFISAVQDIDSVGVIVCDTSLPEAPIIFGNIGFQTISGYSLDEIVGRSCRFMQGTRTAEDSIDAMREAMRQRTGCSVKITNYRKDGSSFNNMISLKPLLDATGRMLFMVAVNIEVRTEPWWARQSDRAAA